MVRATLRELDGLPLRDASKMPTRWIWGYGEVWLLLHL